MLGVLSSGQVMKFCVLAGYYDVLFVFILYEYIYLDSAGSGGRPVFISTLTTAS